MLNVYDVDRNSEIYGPGQRVVIWLQGCGLRCKGCWNQELWSFEPNKLYSSEELYQLIIQEKDIEGITLIGGEPLYQSKALLPFAKKIKEVGLSIVLFTGFEVEELVRSHDRDLLDLSDIIISGRYIEEKRNTFLQWRGSTNQKIIFNTRRYIHCQIEEGNYCEIEIDHLGRMIISGFPEGGLLE